MKLSWSSVLGTVSLLVLLGHCEGGSKSSNVLRSQKTLFNNLLSSLSQADAFGQAPSRSNDREFSTLHSARVAASPQTRPVRQAWYRVLGNLIDETLNNIVRALISPTRSSCLPGNSSTNVVVKKFCDYVTLHDTGYLLPIFLFEYEIEYLDSVYQRRQDLVARVRGKFESDQRTLRETGVMPWNMCPTLDDFDFYVKIVGAIGKTLQGLLSQYPDDQVARMLLILQRYPTAVAKMMDLEEKKSA